ncbi:MAG TPA: alpha-amylase, partial [Vicinamibacteria bacterium]
LENHDEPRAAATFSPGVHEAAAVITFLSPGLRFFHQGQFEGRKKRISPHLVRAPLEPTDETLQRFYDGLLSVLSESVLRDGRWRLLECVPAWEGNGTFDGFIAYAWEGQNRERLLIAVNYAGQQGQCYLRLPFPDLAGLEVHLEDRMGPARYDRQGNDLVSQGLYLDMPPWSYHVFQQTTGDIS